MNALVTIKGWCPTALRPMMSGDGLLVRLNIEGAALTPDRLLTLAVLAKRYGNGFVDLTQRANLQLRGVQSHKFPPLLDALRECGLLSEADADIPVNILVGPLADLDCHAWDVRSVAACLRDALRGDADFATLPSKFGFALDGGGRLPLGDTGADITLSAAPDDRAVLGIAGAPVAAIVRRQEAWEPALRLTRAFLALRRDERRMRSLVERVGAKTIFAHASLVPSAITTSSQPTAKPLGLLPLSPKWLLGVAAPFGAWHADDLAAIARSAGASPDASIRVTPWRVLLIAGLLENDARRASVDLAARGLITTPRDPRLRVAACAGAPACASAQIETRAFASEVSRILPAGDDVVVHVSGCAKGCAHPRAAPLTFVGTEAGLDLVNGAAHDLASRSLSPQGAKHVVQERYGT